MRFYKGMELSVVRSHFQAGISSTVFPVRNSIVLSSSNVMTIIFSKG